MGGGMDHSPAAQAQLVTSGASQSLLAQKRKYQAKKAAAGEGVAAAEERLVF